MEYLKSLLYPFKRWFLAGVVILGSIGLFLHMRGCDKRRDVQLSSETLAPNEEAKVIVDPWRRKITLITPEKVKSFILPDRPSSISLLKGDGFKIQSPQFGTEIRPFFGGVYTLKGGRLLVGIDTFYWKLLDVGIGFSVNPTFVQNTTVFTSVSCFIYSNTSVMLGLDSQQAAMIGIKVRI